MRCGWHGRISILIWTDTACLSRSPWDNRGPEGTDARKCKLTTIPNDVLDIALKVTVVCSRTCFECGENASRVTGQRGRSLPTLPHLIVFAQTRRGFPVTITWYHPTCLWLPANIHDTISLQPYIIGYLIKMSKNTEINEKNHTWCIYFRQLLSTFFYHSRSSKMVSYLLIKSKI